ncbi:MAG: serine hydrolase domain-containing protein [Alphaproteobacteria bacterium]
MSIKRHLSLVFLVLCVFMTPAKAADLVPLPTQAEFVPWPTKAWPVGWPGQGVDESALRALVDHAFNEPVSEDLPGTRAAIVVHRGRIVAERYAEGFSAEQLFLSQSVAKTVLGAVVGLTVRDGLLALDQPAPVAAWQDADDPRAGISINNLMQMSDGLDFVEDYFNPFRSDVLPMLFGEHRKDMAAYVASRPLEHDPGTYWSYSSGTTNLLSSIVRDVVGGMQNAYADYLERELFAPIGMTTAEPEFDGSGTWVGSSWLHATARDWARFGLFMLRGGIWEGRQILPEGWVDYMRTPLAHEPRGIYGGQTWLNAGPVDDPAARRIEALPADTFMATGHRGQYLIMVPSKDLVIVRLGRTGYIHYPAVVAWLGEIVDLFPDVHSAGEGAPVASREDSLSPEGSPAP